MGQAPLRRLTRTQIQHTIRDALGVTADVSVLAGDEKVGPFDSNVVAPVSQTNVEQYRVLAETVAEDLQGSFSSLVDCDVAAEDLDCLGELVEERGRLLFRRSLTDEEVELYVQLGQGHGVDFEDGSRIVTQALLQSPHFLYQVELGVSGQADELGRIPLTGPELATRLAFLLWDSGPDGALLDTAEAGGLDTVDGLSDAAESMILDPRARRGIGAFHQQWLGIDHLEQTVKDPEVYPLWSEEMSEAAMDETSRFTYAVVFNDGTLDTLLTSDESYIEGPLFELYGVQEPPNHQAGNPVAVNRSGILGHASFLASHSLPNQSGPVQRGAVVLEDFFCQELPPPPPDVDATPPTPQPGATTRELFAAHTEDPACAGCHVRIDGIGFGLEGYDGIGAFRTMEEGKPVDESGELVGTDVDGEFVGLDELAQRLGESEDVQDCFVRQWFRYTHGRGESEDDSCSVEAMAMGFEQTDGNIRSLILSAVQTESFRYLKGE